MSFLVKFIPHVNYGHFRSDKHIHRDEMFMSFDDVCRNLVLPSEAKIVDRSDRVASAQAVHQGLFGAR